MEISPRYDTEPIIRLDGRADDQRATVAGQRHRLVAALEGFDADAWQTASRCQGWVAQDVVNHLVVTDRFWLSSVEAGLAGAPSRVLAGFDPKATPAVLADAMRSQTPAESLDQLASASRALADALGALDDDGWSTIAEAPPGHVPIRVLAHHALWDGWVHERDILLPLGIDPVEEPAEVRSALRYAAALGPSFALSSSPDARGALVLDLTDGDHVVVEVDGDVSARDGGDRPDGALVLQGSTIELLETLSVRRPMTQHIPTHLAWLVAGLAEVFESDAVCAAQDPVRG